MDRYCDKGDFRFVYFGTPGVSGDLLTRLIEAGYQVAALVCNPDKPVGRKHLLCPCPTKEEACRCGIPVFQPERIRLDYAFLHSIQADFYLTFSYGQIVPKGVLEIPPKGCLNLHGSLLPELRGAAPMQRAIELGLTETGVTLMEMVEKMDAGRMYAKRSFPILETDNLTDVSAKMAEAAFRCFDENIIPYLNGELPGVEQDESQVTFAKKISKEEEKLDLSLSPKRFADKARSLSYEPGVYLLLDGRKIKLLRCLPVPGESKAMGRLYGENGRLYLDLAHGRVELLEVQLEGKKPTDGRSYLLGHHDEAILN